MAGGMIPSDLLLEAQTSPIGSTPDGRSAGGTLPPPEWTSPKPGARGPAAMIIPKPLIRRTGVRATEAWLRARVESARAAGDPKGTREACAALARWLASHDRDLDEAVELAALALELGPDIELRREQSAWLESLGEAARAAAVLKPIAALAEVESSEAAHVLWRVGVLKARAGAASAAAAAFESALSLDGSDPLPGELLGTLSTWQPDVVPPEIAVDAYVEAARRRAALRQDDAELMNLWRAFAVDAANETAASALADALEHRERAAAADEVLRVHAFALTPADRVRAANVHARRRVSAVLAREPARALGAALDEGLDACLDGQEGQVFDALLLDLGMLEPLATRLELRAERATEPAERAAHFVELARLYGGPLADERRAADAYVAALAACPTCEEAITALRVRLTHPRLGLRLDSEEGRDASLRAMAISIFPVPDEHERRARLVAKLHSVLPIGVETSRARGGPDGSDTAAAAWARVAVQQGSGAAGSALERVAASESAPVRAVLLAAAADRHRAAGNAVAARSNAELAARTDPTNTRCIAALADAAVVQNRDRRAAAALERAIGVVGPRTSWCFALADALDQIGETELAVGWSQRYVALHPGDRGAIELLLERSLRAGDGSRLRDALAWLIAQPQPATWATEALARALSNLARIDAERAAVVARRALDVFGPKSPALREAMLGVAERTSDHAFAAAILERWLSAGAEGSDRRQLFVRLTELRRALGDDEGQARIAARAAREGLRDLEFDPPIEKTLESSASADAQLWRLRASAERLAGDDDTAASIWAWRDLGGALWDLADDRVGAVAAWQRAARVAPGGYAALAFDLVAFAGAEFAFEYLVRVVETEPDDATSGAIAAEAAGLALSIGHARFAFDLAARGLARSPTCTGALDAAERAAQRADEQAALSALYDLVAASALGRFGRRAAHYRGARFYERCGEHALALKHAAQAFYAVPSEGSMFLFLARTAEQAGDRPLAMRTVEQVAEREERNTIRARWLLRAASIAGGGEDGTRQKVDVLLRAVVACPNVTTIDGLRSAARELLRLGPEERDGLELRLGHAARTIGGRVEGPEGARISIAFAVTLLELFGDSDGALAAIERAFAADAEVDEFHQLMKHAAALGRAPEARERLAAMLSASETAQVNAGIPVLRLLSALATAAGEEALCARASVGAAVRAPDDDDLIVAAEDAIRLVPELTNRFAGQVAPARRVAALVAAARARVAAGGHGDAALLFERAGELLEKEARAEVERELRAALDAAGRGGEIEERAYREAAAGIGSPAAQASHWVEVAELREGRGDTAGAVAALLEACRLDPESLERWSALERVAEIAGDDDAQVAALEKMQTQVGDDGRVTVLRRLARAQERRADLEAAERTWRRVLELDYENDEADQAMQSVIVARGDYDELVAHLSLRAERLSGDPEKREMLRAVRLRRAAILEQRLGRTNDACDELALLLREWPDSAVALRYLADLLERQSEYGRSAPLWRRAAALEPNPNERDELELRAARASRAAGDLDAKTRADLLLQSAQSPQLLARGLEYRIQGPGGPDDARRTIEELGGIVEPLTPDDSALRAFLFAEALDVVQGSGAGLRELEATRAVIGEHPVLALGVAERLVAQGQDGAAVHAFQFALTGRLFDLRKPWAVALAGADAAIRAGAVSDAMSFLDIAERYEDARAGAAARREGLMPAALPELAAAVHSARSPIERARARLALASGRLESGDVRGAEPLLWEALADGLSEAGDVLAPLLASSADRMPDLVRVRWQQVALEPGDAGRLESLRAAALADDDRTHARAVEHVLRAFDAGSGPIPPPPLAAQPEQRGILALLAGPSMDGPGEAFALLWEGAMQLFVRDPASYGITGIERVVPGASSAIARVYEATMRVLDVPRIPLFVARSTAGALESQVALLSPPSMILSGDVREETAELRFELGRGIAAALPHNVLRCALPDAEGRAVAEALRTAFGPPELGRQVAARVARLAESFWQMIPARTQRRLQELLRAAPMTDYAELVESALQSGRRVGMFLAGDFGCAARMLLAEHAPRVYDTPSLGNLHVLCAEVPALADLLRLAVRPEYAGARWHSGASTSPRRTASSGRFSLF
jgi:tetratricopeptide (TPR) repeat protein